MDTSLSFADQVEDYEANIDELEAALQPLLSAPLNRLSTTLPLLDKAKLYVLSTYAIESLLFTILQASGANAKDHAVFAELGRLKSYFQKIKKAETMGDAPKMRLDKGAAARFISAGLAGNERFDLERQERLAKERARAAIKANQLAHKRFDEDGMEATTENVNKMQLERAGEDHVESNKSSNDKDESEEDDDDDDEDDNDGEDSSPRSSDAAPSEDTDMVDSSSAPSPTPQKLATLSKSERKATRKVHKAARRMANQDIRNVDGDQTGKNETRKPKKPHGNSPAAREARRAKKMKRRVEKMEADTKAGKDQVILTDRAPKTHSEAFTALLEGEPSRLKPSSKGKRKG